MSRPKYLNYSLLLLIVAHQLDSIAGQCKPSITTVSGSRVPQGQICSGQLLLDEQFKTLDSSLWKHENTLGGGGNWEFQWYTSNKDNSFVRDDKLHLRPSLTSALYGEKFLSSGKINLWNDIEGHRCTNPDHYGCERSGTPDSYLNPIRSARVNTKDAFAFKYGKVEVRAKIPSGDWLWPAIWLLPKSSAYGIWPRSGEIDIMEARGNRQLTKNGVNIGTEQVGSTLHFGLDTNNNRWDKAHFEKNLANGFDKDFHRYGVEWSDQHIKFYMDDQLMGTVEPQNGFWALGGFGGDANQNPWKDANKMAPFDQEFYIILNLAVGGVNYFSDDATNPHKKPWHNQSPTAPKDFWNAKNDWLPTWHLDQNNGDDASLIVDYVKVWAL